MNPETRARIRGMIEGVARIDASESPFAAVRRFHELEREARSAREVSDRSEETPPYGIRILGAFQDADLAIYAAGFSRRIAKGPGLGRKLVIFDGVIKIPLPEARKKTAPVQRASR